MIPLRDAQRTRRRPWATWAIAAGCAGTFAWELSLGERLPAELGRWAASPHDIATLERPWSLPLRLLAAMFLHGGWLHLAGNLAFLLVFGDDVEVKLRWRRFLVLYLVSGLVATLAQAAATPASRLPIVGASGAIAGVLGTFLVLFPKARLAGVLPLGCLFVPLRTRAFLFLPGWFLLQLASALMEPAGGGGVAWYAHLAGFAAGPIVFALIRGR